MCHMYIMCSRSAVILCRSKQAQDRHSFKNQMVIDKCRVVLTFTINDDIFHHKFFCDILVFHVYFKLNLIIYTISNTFLCKKKSHFLHIIIFVYHSHNTEIAKQLLCMYTKYNEGKTGIYCYYTAIA